VSKFGQWWDRIVAERTGGNIAVLDPAAMSRMREMARQGWNEALDTVCAGMPAENREQIMDFYEPLR
jgi:hypothetical protein